MEEVQVQREQDIWISDIFFIKDRVASNEIRIEYCPTEDMIADFFTKPLQGKQFYKLRDQVMNIDPSSKYHSDHRSVLKPDVENVKSQDSEPTIGREEGAQTRTDDTVSVVGANDAANLTRSYRDVVTSGEELTRWAHSIGFT